MILTVWLVHDDRNKRRKGGSVIRIPTKANSANGSRLRTTILPPLLPWLPSSYVQRDPAVTNTLSHSLGFIPIIVNSDFLTFFVFFLLPFPRQHDKVVRKCHRIFSWWVKTWKLKGNVTCEDYLTQILPDIVIAAVAFCRRGHSGGAAGLCRNIWYCYDGGC